jgi:hypothetical protein
LIATRLLIGVGLVDVTDAALAWVGEPQADAGIGPTPIAEIPEHVKECGPDRDR